MKDYDIAFLHTGQIHVNTFDRLVADLSSNTRVHHIVDEQLLDDARRDGITAELEQRIEQAMLKGASAGAKLVVCTCSTIGGAAEPVGERHGFTSMRIDRAMANEAVAIGEKILVLAALKSTLTPTLALLKSSAEIAQKTPQIELKPIDHAWAYFESGDLEQYYQLIAEAIKRHEKAYDVIVLAQASMSKATEYCEGVKTPVLSSPGIGVKAALSELRRI